METYNNKNDMNSRLLTREEEIELNYNSMKRIQPFFREMEKWSEEMRTPLIKNPRVLSCVN